MSTIAFFSVVYPSVERYLDAFLDSLENQTLKNFDIYMANDGLDGFARCVRRFGNRGIEMRLEGSPAGVREAGIKRMLQGGRYDTVVFGDSDDVFAVNRVEKATELLRKADIVVNDLDLIGAEGNIIEKNYLSKRLKNGDEITSDFILDKNLLGFTNTAVRAGLLDQLRLPDDLIAVDWFLFASLLEKGFKAVFTNETSSLYRQHDANAVGLKRITRDGFLKGIRAKTVHYRYMSAADQKYVELYEKFKRLDDAFVSDAKLLDSYLNEITAKNIQNPFWWEEIVAPEDK